MKNKNVIFTRGMQASGKTTWAKEFVKNNPSYIRISRDDFRYMLDDYSHSKETESIITKMINSCINDAIACGKNIVIDEMHLNNKHLKEKIDFFTSKNYNIEIKEFPIHISEAIARNKKRQQPINESILKKTWKQYEVELKQMIKKHKIVYTNSSNLNLPHCIICDIDGTLSDSSQRKIYDDDVSSDEIISPVRDVINQFADKVEIILVSGRKEKSRKQTEDWLHKQSVRFKHLYMRKNDDNRSDVVVKKEIFDEFIRYKYIPMFVIDDRPCVVEMWVEMGLFVFNVNQDPRCKNDF